MKITSPYVYNELSSVTNKETGKRFYVCPEGHQLASVTTILSATKDMSGLLEWRKRIGDKKADEEVKAATSIGSVMHRDIEHYIRGEERLKGGNLIRKMARQMANNIIEQGLIHVDEVWGIEVPVYFSGSYAGRSDLIGVYKGVPCIMDFKNSKKIKKREWVHDYFMQGCAYALAHNNMFDTNIQQMVIFMASRDMQFETYVLEGEEFNYFMGQWIQRLEDWYNLQA
jgi:genome maintenance exonuclease 1